MDRTLIDNPEDGQVIVIDDHEKGTLGRMIVYNHDEAAQVLRMPPEVIHALIEALEGRRCMQGTRRTSITIPETAMRHKGWTYWVYMECRDRKQAELYHPSVCWMRDTDTLRSLPAEPTHQTACDAAIAYIDAQEAPDDNPASAQWGGLQESLQQKGGDDALGSGT